MSKPITLNDCIEELARTIEARDKFYPQLIEEGKLKQWQMEKRKEIMQTLLRLCKTAKKKKTPTLVELLDKMD